MKNRWARFWMRYAHWKYGGHIAARLAGVLRPPLYGCVPLARLNSRGYISPRAQLFHGGSSFGSNCFIGDRVLIYKDKGGGTVTLGDGVHIHQDTTIQTGATGSTRIGAETHIQPRCQISAYLGPVNIGERVEIAPNCGFYSYNHGIEDRLPIRKQPIQTQGGITVEDDVWIGFGVVVLDGAHIGEGAVIGAGAVVASDIPSSAIAAGVPARVIGTRKAFAADKHL